MLGVRRDRMTMVGGSLVLMRAAAAASYDLRYHETLANPTGPLTCGPSGP